MAATKSSLWTGLVGTTRVPLNRAADLLHRQEGGVVSLIAVVQMLLLLLMVVEVNAGIAKLSLLMDVVMALRPAGTIGMMSRRGRPSLPSATVGVDGIGRHKVLLVLQRSIVIPGTAAPATRGRRSSSSSSSVGKVVSITAILGQV